MSTITNATILIREANSLYSKAEACTRLGNAQLAAYKRGKAAGRDVEFIAAKIEENIALARDYTERAGELIRMASIELDSDMTEEERAWREQEEDQERVYQEMVHGPWII